MTVTSIDQDTDDLTLTLIADFEAPIERVWELWADARQLERWWGPPSYPATVEAHDLTPGGDVTYFMTGPEGERFHGMWKVTAVDPPRSLEFFDRFADENGRPVADKPSIVTRMQLDERDGGTRMELVSTFESREAMQELEEMGMVEGIQESVGQMDALLAE